MRIVIFYSSTYNGNTLKIAESIAVTLSADLITIETKISDFDIFHPLSSVSGQLSQNTEKYHKTEENPSY